MRRVPIPDISVGQNTGISYVIPAWRIAEVLDRDELKQQRREAEAAFLKGRPRGTFPMPNF